MLEDRKKSFDEISRILAITRYDIEQHQLINDQSLNIHGESWFRDIFNYVYEINLINANFQTSNCPAVDLVDNKEKLAYQITTTRTKEKVENTLDKIQNTVYKSFDLKIFFLLDKANFNAETVLHFQQNYGINVKTMLLDYRDLIKDIENLEGSKLLTLNRQYFVGKTEKYTDEIVLNLIFKQLLKEKKSVTIDYDDDFGTVDTNQKLILNKINNRISLKINEGLDYRVIIEDYVEDENLLSDLRKYIIDTLYKNILIQELSKATSKKSLLDKKAYELQDIAFSKNLDFNKIISKLHKEIENNIEINDFNSMNIAWIIIAYFFELCDIGVDEL